MTFWVFNHIPPPLPRAVAPTSSISCRAFVAVSSRLGSPAWIGFKERLDPVTQFGFVRVICPPGPVRRPFRNNWRCFEFGGETTSHGPTPAFAPWIFLLFCVTPRHGKCNAQPMSGKQRPESCGWGGIHSATLNKSFEADF